MKRIILCAVIALFAQSCIISSDKKIDENPQRQSVEYLHDAVIRSVYVAVETVDFFDRYQKIRSDRDAAITLAKEYYGEDFYDGNLVYENFIGHLGQQIYLTEIPGQYILELGHIYPYKLDTKYFIEVLEDRRYRITTTPFTKSLPPEFTEFEVTLECIATVGEDFTAVIETLSLEYLEEIGEQITKASIKSAQDPIKFKLGNNQWNIWPFTGTMDFTISGRVVNDEFSVKYNESGYYIL